LLIIANTQGSHSSWNFSLLLEVIYFGGFFFVCLFFFFSLQASQQQPGTSVFLMFVCRKLSYTESVLLTHTIYMVIMHQASLRDTLCTPWSLQKVTPK